MPISRSAIIAALLLCSAMMGCQSTAKPLQEQLPPEFKDIQVSSDLLFEKKQDSSGYFAFTLYPEGKESSGIGGQQSTSSRLLPNGDVEVGAQFILNPVEEVSSIYVAVYPSTPPMGESWPKNVARVLQNKKPYGVVEAKYDPEKKKHLGLVVIKAKDLYWEDLQWSPETSETADFIVSVLVVGKDQVITRNVFNGNVLRPKDKK